MFGCELGLGQCLCDSGPPLRQVLKVSTLFRWKHLVHGETEELGVGYV